jgi:hypothetical protein
MSRIEELEKQITELDERKVALQYELELEKQKIEIEYPFHLKGECWQLRTDGLVKEDWWSSSGYDRNCYQQGNMFTTQQEAKKEREKRTLLTRFRQFRDKCNGDWKPDWKVIEDSYNYYIEMYYGYGNAKLRTDWSPSSASFNLFGYFKKQEDCERAIRLFGDEIKRLFVEG